MAEIKQVKIGSTNYDIHAKVADSISGVTATTTELNYVDGVTSNIQTQLNDKAPKSHGIHYIEGTGDTAGTWLGTHADITEYYAGLVLAYKIGVAGLSSGTTLNINNLGAVTVVKNATSAISTDFAVNSVIFLVYTIDDNGTAYWKAHDYDSNTKTTTGTSNKASTKLYLTGATSQTSSGTTTYSNSKVYIGTDNCLYSNGKKVSTTDTNTTYTFATGSSNGTISVTPSGGTATNVAVKGLGSAAYTASTAYDAAGTAQTKADAALASAKTYADGIKNDLLNGAGAAYDTLKELGDLINVNTDAIDALEIVAAGKADKTHSHAISDVTNLQSTLDGKAAKSHGTHVSYSTTAPVMDGTASVGTATTVARSDHKHPTDTSRASKTEFDTHTSNTTVHITSTERSNWNAAKTHADSAHAPSNAEKNQNAFSNIKVGSTTIAADIATDTLELVGSNVTITPDATNDKVTIAVANASTGTKGIVQLTNSTSSTSTTTAATPNSVKSAYDLANTAKTNAATAQTKANEAYDIAGAALPKAGGTMTGSVTLPNLQSIKVSAAGTENTNPQYVAVFNTNDAAQGMSYSSVANLSKNLSISLPIRLQEYQTSNGVVTDPNNATKTGFYYVKGMINRPAFSQSANDDYRILVTSYNDTWLQQIATDFRCNDIFLRRKENNVWKPWVRLAMASELDTKANASHTHTVANISDLTATATELNYVDGVTSNIQTQLNNLNNAITWGSW